MHWICAVTNLEGPIREFSIAPIGVLQCVCISGRTGEIKLNNFSLLRRHVAGYDQMMSAQQNQKVTAHRITMHAYLMLKHVYPE
jgi:hypothetical protein